MSTSIFDDPGELERIKQLLRIPVVEEDKHDVGGVPRDYVLKRKRVACFDIIVEIFRKFSSPLSALEVQTRFHQLCGLQFRDVTGQPLLAFLSEPERSRVFHISLDPDLAMSKIHFATPAAAVNGGGGGGEQEEGLGTPSESSVIGPPPDESQVDGARRCITVEPDSTAWEHKVLQFTSETHQAVSAMQKFVDISQRTVGYLRSIFDKESVDTMPAEKLVSIFESIVGKSFQTYTDCDLMEFIAKYPDLFFLSRATNNGDNGGGGLGGASSVNVVCLPMKVELADRAQFESTQQRKDEPSKTSSGAARERDSSSSGHRSSSSSEYRSERDRERRSDRDRERDRRDERDYRDRDRDRDRSSSRSDRDRKRSRDDGASSRSPPPSRSGRSSVTVTKGFLGAYATFPPDKSISDEDMCIKARSLQKQHSSDGKFQCFSILLEIFKQMGSPIAADALFSKFSRVRGTKFMTLSGDLTIQEFILQHCPTTFVSMPSGAMSTSSTTKDNVPDIYMRLHPDDVSSEISKYFLSSGGNASNAASVTSNASLHRHVEGGSRGGASAREKGMSGGSVIIVPPKMEANTWCAKFDGSTGLIRICSPFVVRGALTVECWFRVPPGSTVGPYRTLVSGWWPEVDNSCFTLYWNKTGLAFGLQNMRRNVETVQSGGRWDDGMWHHVAGVWDGDADLKIYVDGVERHTRTIRSFGPVSATCNPVVIGSDDTWYPEPNNDRLFSGDIKDVRIWSVARSRLQIIESADDSSKLMSAPTGASSPGGSSSSELTAWWPLDDGTGTLVRERVRDAKGVAIKGVSWEKTTPCAWNISTDDPLHALRSVLERAIWPRSIVDLSLLATKFQELNHGIPFTIFANCPLDKFLLKFPDMFRLTREPSGVIMVTYLPYERSAASAPLPTVSSAPVLPPTMPPPTQPPVSMESQAIKLYERCFWSLKDQNKFSLRFSELNNLFRALSGGTSISQFLGAHPDAHQPLKLIEHHPHLFRVQGTGSDPVIAFIPMEPPKTKSPEPMAPPQRTLPPPPPTAAQPSASGGGQMTNVLSQLASTLEGVDFHSLSEHELQHLLENVTSKLGKAVGQPIPLPSGLSSPPSSAPPPPVATPHAYAPHTYPQQSYQQQQPQTAPSYSPSTPWMQVSATQASPYGAASYGAQPTQPPPRPATSGGEDKFAAVLSLINSYKAGSGPAPAAQTPTQPPSSAPYYYHQQPGQPATAPQPQQPQQYTWQQQQQYGAYGQQYPR